MSGGTGLDRIWDLSGLWRFSLAILAVGVLVNGTAAADTSGETSAKRLVAEALRAEVAGDVARRAALLDEAIHATPDCNLARWSRGEVRADGAWLPVDEAQRAAAADPRHIEYLALRADYGDQPEAQLALARWCRRNNLNDEARIHWANVLSFQPNNEEALRALGANWFAGRLMTYAQIDSAKREMRESRRAAKLFKPQIAKWQRMLSAGDIASRDAALEEVRSLADVDAIPAMEELTLYGDVDTTPEQERCRHLSLAFVEALGEMPDPAAAASLARHAVLAPISDVRDAAIERLKERPMYDYVPLLLDALAMPVESTFQVTTDPDGSVHYRHSLYVDGRQGDWSLENVRTVWQKDLGGRRTVVDLDGNIRGSRLPRESDAEVAGRIATVAARSQQQFATAAVTVEQQVARMNEAAAAFNKQITSVLAKTTGEKLGENPQEWWSWWQRYNEYYSSGEDPVYEQRNSESSHNYYRVPSTDLYNRRKTSCFPRGTLVWTNTGRRAIETIEIGDLVLAQDVDTGELAYQPVVGRTVRPPSPILKMTLGEEELRTTLGHPLWVAGVGWRMAKQVGDAAILHGVYGPVQVDAVEPAGESEAFNLVVADFNTYFVGESGVLVHDNTPREPTAAAVPGLVPE
jgi:hypothetical protein